MRTDIHTYPIAERPDVEVLVDGEWVTGQARMRWREGDQWFYDCAYASEHHSSKLDTFPAERVRTVGGRS